MGMSEKHKLSVEAFSILPMQNGIEIETPDGIGTYEAFTSSGLVTVLINGGLKTYGWSEVMPLIKLRHIEKIGQLSKELVQHYFETNILPKNKLLKDRMH